VKKKEGLRTCCRPWFIILVPGISSWLVRIAVRCECQ